MKVIGVCCSLALLAAFTSAVEIQCEYRNLTWTVGTFYSCWATVVSVANPTIVTDITGTHVAGKTNADVKAFYTSSHKILTKIPSGIESFFPNLEVFEWTFGNISTIDSNTFTPWPNLLRIDLGWNKIVSLDGNLFQYTRKLQLIFLNLNSLEHVGHDLLTFLTDLTWVSFSSNPCINMNADTPQKLRELRTQLPIQCPPKPMECPSTCMIDEMMGRIAELERPDSPTTTISTSTECPITCTSNEETQGLKEMIDDLQRQITKLENIVREIQIPVLAKTN